MGIWNPEYECMPREQLRELQGKRLKKTVERVYNNVPLYRQKMVDKGIEPGDIKSIDDLKSLPYTYKQDLRDTYPYGLFATPMSEVVRIHASSGELLLAIQQGILIHGQRFVPERWLLHVQQRTPLFIMPMVMGSLQVV